jgi:hypothetical protein
MPRLAFRLNSRGANKPFQYSYIAMAIFLYFKKFLFRSGNKFSKLDEYILVLYKKHYGKLSQMKLVKK